MLSTPQTQNWVNETSLTDEEKLGTKERAQSFFHFKENAMDRKISIFDLPTEIMLKIFSYLDTFTLTNKVKLVCKSWNILAGDASLWKSLSFEGKDDISYISEVIAKCPQLQLLRIQGGTVDSSLFSAASHLSHLQSVSINFCNILSDCVITFKEFMKHAARLNFLDLEGCEVSGEILDTISQGKGLKYLSLSHCIHLENQSLIQILESCSKLEQLDIDGINFLEEFAINSIFRIRSGTIESLLLDGELHSDNAFIHLEDCLNLTKLSISFCDSLTDHTLFQLMQLQHLKFLKLRKGFSLTAAGLEKLFKFGTMSQLTHLNLSECSLLLDSTLIAIADSCHELLSLNLSWCWELTDESLFHVVQKCPKLIVMDLTGLVRLQGHFLMDLKQGQLKDLKVIDLEQCGCIEDDQLVKLAELRPTVKIFGFWGDIMTAKSE